MTWSEARQSADWLHINAATYVGSNRWYDAGDQRFHPDNIIWSSREANIIAIIDRSGKVVWRMGPDYRTSEPLRALGQIIGQHHPHIIPKGLPGAGNLLVFDNGGQAGYGAPNPAAPDGVNSVRRISSRVLELNPVTFEKIWEYSIPGQEQIRFFSQYVSSAQRLPNGNTLVTEGAIGRIFELTAGKEIVWGYAQPILQRAEHAQQPHLPGIPGGTTGCLRSSDRGNAPSCRPTFATSGFRRSDRYSLFRGATHANAETSLSGHRSRVCVECVCAGRAAAVDTAAEEAALKATTATWLEAYNAGDVEKIVAMYAEDGVLMPPHAAVATGHAAIRVFLAADTAGAKAAGVKLVPGANVAGVAGDTGWESGSYTVADTSGATVDSGSYLSVSRKVNGKWLYVRDTYNSDRPLPPPPAAPEPAEKK